MYLGFGVMGLVCLFFFRVVLVWFLFGWVFLIVFCVCVVVFFLIRVLFAGLI